MDSLYETLNKQELAIVISKHANHNNAERASLNALVLSFATVQFGNNICQGYKRPFLGLGRSYSEVRLLIDLLLG